MELRNYGRRTGRRSVPNPNPIDLNSPEVLIEDATQCRSVVSVVSVSNQVVSVRLDNHLREWKFLTEKVKAGVRNNAAANRFEIEVEGGLAVSNYIIRGHTIYFVHTEVPPSLEGQGIGNTLARASLDYARANNLRVVPQCPFIAAFINRHEEYQNLVDADR